MHTQDSKHMRMVITLTRFREEHPAGFVRRDLTDALLTQIYRAVFDADRDNCKTVVMRRAALILQKFRNIGKARFNRETRRLEWNETGPILLFLAQDAATSCNTHKADAFDTPVAC